MSAASSALRISPSSRRTTGRSAWFRPARSPRSERPSGKFGERVKPAQDWLDHMATNATGATGTQPQNFEAFLNARGASVTPAQRDSLFREFLTWQTERQKAARGGARQN